MSSIDQLVVSILSGEINQETNWLEWKSEANLGVKEWQARVAKFILGVANRPSSHAVPEHEGLAYVFLGLEPGRLHGTLRHDPASVGAGLSRYLGHIGPTYELDYLTVAGRDVAVVTVPPTSAAHRPYLARGTFSGTKLVIRDGAIYVRRAGVTDEASAAEIDQMLEERAGWRAAAAQQWPMQPVDGWRDGTKVYVRKLRGDELIIIGEDNYTNLMEMAQKRPSLPVDVAEEIRRAVTGDFQALHDVADDEPMTAIEDAWPPTPTTHHRGLQAAARERRTLESH